MCMHVSFPVLINVPSIPIFSGPFIMKGHFIFSKVFFAPVEKSCDFCPEVYLCTVLHLLGSIY